MKPECHPSAIIERCCNDPDGWDVCSECGVRIGCYDCDSGSADPYGISGERDACSNCDTVFYKHANESEFYWMTLEPLNIGDLLRDLAEELSPVYCSDPRHNVPCLRKCPACIEEGCDDTRTILGIVSEKDGGIIAYAIGEDHANEIVGALNKCQPSE